MKRLFSVPEIAERFEVTNQTVRNWIASGRLPAVQPMRRGRYRIPSDVLATFERDAASGERGAVARSRRSGPAGPRPRAAAAPDTGNGSMPDEELARVVRAIVAAVHPESVILFGSRARGDAGPGADFDLAVIAPDGTQRRPLAMRAYESVATIDGRSVGVDVVVLTPRIIAAERDLAGSIARAVVREGVAVYGPAIA